MESTGYEGTTDPSTAARCARQSNALAATCAFACAATDEAQRMASPSSSTVPLSPAAAAAAAPPALHSKPTPTSAICTFCGVSSSSSDAALRMSAQSGGSRTAAKRKHE